MSIAIFGTTSSTTHSTSATTSATSSTQAEQDRQAGRVSWKRGLATGLVAAAVVTVVAGAFQASGHALAVTDGAIPLTAFAQMVLLATVVGIVIARHTSRATFYRVSVALTALSCVAGPRARRRRAQQGRPGPHPRGRGRDHHPAARAAVRPTRRRSTGDCPG